MAVIMQKCEVTSWAPVVVVSSQLVNASATTAVHVRRRQCVDVLNEQAGSAPVLNAFRSTITRVCPLFKALALVTQVLAARSASLPEGLCSLTLEGARLARCRAG